MAKFLLEIGSEEIPARFLKNEEKEIVDLSETALREAGLDHGSVKAMVTPRRLVLVIDDVAEKQAEKEEILVGPPIKAAYDAGGQPTKALLGFAKGAGAAPEDAFSHKTEKGEYLAIRRKTGGKPALAVLSEICPAIIGKLSFPKSMRWGANAVSYPRPIRWIVALLDSEIVPFNFGPVSSGRTTFGHRVHGSGAREIPSANDYDRIAKDSCGITADFNDRRKTIINTGDELARKNGHSVIWKDSLLDEVCGLAERPVPILCDFDPGYLEVPEEVLLTSMESHQKSFGIRDASGKLAPRFLTVLNIAPRDPAIVKNGWERVLRARLEDARFFWKSDLASSFADWLDKLERVIFIGKLGSMADKGRRLSRLCRWIASQLPPGTLDPDLAARAGELAKADLVSAMVGEFDTLQGIMGGIYARKAGESETVAQAIQEQYLPAGPDSPLPQSLAGCVLSIADKADTLAGCFGLGMIPTGAADPNGLRRCALGVIRVILDKNLTLNIDSLFAEARALYGDRAWKLPDSEASEKLLEFFRNRLRGCFLAMGYNAVMVDAVLATGNIQPTDCRARLDALAAFSKQPGYARAAQTLKRAENIGKKSGADVSGDNWDQELLVEEEEKILAENLSKILPEIDKNIAAGDYGKVLKSLESLGEPMDKFFDKVLVMCEDPGVRANRLKMLKAVARRFGSVAQFSLLQI